MSLNTLIERGRTVAEYGRALAERVPYSLVALVSRFAVASVFWRSGQTKVHGFHIREETFDLFREEYKVPLLRPTWRHTSPRRPNTSFRYCSLSVLLRGSPLVACYS